MQARAKVVYVEDHFIKIFVECFVYTENYQKKIKTNDLYVCFICPDKSKLKSVYPVSYEDGILYLNAKEKLN